MAVRTLIIVVAAFIPIWVVYVLKSSRDSIVMFSDCSELVFSAPTKTEMFNKRVNYYKSQVYQPILDNTKVNCTMIMAAYKRVKMLPLVLNHYCDELSPVNRIVLIWNDPEIPIPPSVLELREKCDKELKFIPMKENNITNRFLPQNLEGTETECEYVDS